MGRSLRGLFTCAVVQVDVVLLYDGTVFGFMLTGTHLLYHNMWESARGIPLAEVTGFSTHGSTKIRVTHRSGHNDVSIIGFDSLRLRSLCKVLTKYQAAMVRVAGGGGGGGGESFPPPVAPPPPPVYSGLREDLPYQEALRMLEVVAGRNALGDSNVLCV